MEGKPNPNMTQQAIKAKYVVIRRLLLDCYKSCRVLRELQVIGNQILK